MAEAALVRGDGIGPEICDAAARVVEASGAVVQWREVLIGQEALRQLQEAVPEDSLLAIRRLGVALKGPLIAPRVSGGISVKAGGEERRYPSINNALRRGLGVFANLRPLRGWPRVSGNYQKMDIVIVREVTEDLYLGCERQVDPDTAEATKRITRSASRRVTQFACDYAVQTGRKRITAVHKANVLHLTDGLFLESARSVVRDYPDLAFDDLMIDAACYHLIKHPEQFDVLVLPNQYGDILSDVAAGLIGSLGLAPGGNLGPEVAMFEATHGAAPDIAGRGIANPIAMVLSAAMLLDHIGQTVAGNRIREGVSALLSEGTHLTPDMGGTATTAELAQRIGHHMEHG
jgi:isocitrate dehydrogenase (NAD+)